MWFVYEWCMGLLDDLYPKKVVYTNLNEMISENKGGWFFAFYKKFDDEFDFVIHNTTALIPGFTANSDSKFEFAVNPDITETCNYENAPTDKLRKIYPSRKRNLVNYEGLCHNSKKKSKLDELFKKIENQKKLPEIYDSEKRKARYNSEKRKANYDSEKRKANYNPEKQKQKSKYNFDKRKTL